MKTKFSVGDEVFVLDDMKFYKDKIVGVRYIYEDGDMEPRDPNITPSSIPGKKETEAYRLNGDRNYHKTNYYKDVSKLFKTKDELIKFLASQR